MSTPQRMNEIAQFLARSGWGNAVLSPLAGDASARRYLRLARGEERAVLMDAPPGSGEDVAPFLFMTTWLRDQGLSAPEILASDPAEGLLLLEDLGDDIYAAYLTARPEREAALYEAAVDLLVALADLPPPALPPYCPAVLDREARLFTEWWLPATGRVPHDAAQTAFAELVAEATAGVAQATDVAVLRDYHAENLLWLGARSGHAKVGLLDYQDTLAGHPAYDLVSLLEDARRDTDPALAEAMIARYLAARPDLEPEAFRAAYAALGAQRNLKIIGIFARLALRDGKPRYLSLIPRVWAHLQRDLAHPRLAALRDWVAGHSPLPEPALLSAIAARVQR